MFEGSIKWLIDWLVDWLIDWLIRGKKQCKSYWINQSIVEPLCHALLDHAIIMGLFYFHRYAETAREIPESAQIIASVHQMGLLTWSDEK